MRAKIKVISNIDVLDQDYEFAGAVPSEAEFKEHGEPMNLTDEYEAEYMDLAEYFELSYQEVDRESGQKSRRTLSHEKGSKLLTIRRDFSNVSTVITVEEGILHKNTYQIDQLGELALETFGLDINWDSDISNIRMKYLTNMNGLWSRIDMMITFEGTALCS